MTDQTAAEQWWGEGGKRMELIEMALVGGTIDDVLDAAYDFGEDVGAAAEREACAGAVDEMCDDVDDPFMYGTLRAVAAAIRSRGEATVAESTEQTDDPRNSSDTDRRWDCAVDRVLNSGLLCGYMDDFWRYVDGEIAWEEFDRRMSP